MISNLAIRGLQKRYGMRQVVSDVSLDVASGEVIGLLGPNGAGKTTSFYMIVGLVLPVFVGVHSCRKYKRKCLSKKSARRMQLAS